MLLLAFFFFLITELQMHGLIFGAFSIFLSMYQSFCAGLLWHFLQVKVSQLQVKLSELCLQLPGRQTWEAGQVFQQTHRAGKQPSRKNPQACKSRLDFVCFQTQHRFFT